jgi:hypothetical protein
MTYGCKGQHNDLSLPLTEGRFLVPYRVDERLGIVDEAGKMIVEPRFTYLLECYPEHFIGFDTKGKVLALFDVFGKSKPLNSFKPDAAAVQEWISSKASPGTFAYTSCNVDTTDDDWMNYGPRAYQMVYKPKQEMKDNGDNFHLADLDGNVLIRNISGPNGGLVKQVNRWLLILERKESTKGGPSGNFLYNLKQKKIVLSIPGISGQYLDEENGFPVLRDGTGVRTFYDAEGREIVNLREKMADLPGSGSSSYSYRQSHVLYHSRENGAEGVAVLAIRSSVKKPFRLYRAGDLKLLDTTFADLDPRTFPHHLSAKKNGKWGLVDADLKTVLPFQYDTSISVYNGEVADVIENGKRFSLNIITGKKLPAPFDIVSSHSVNGLRLAANYTAISNKDYRSRDYEPMVRMLYVIDSVAQVRDSLVVNDYIKAYTYHLMPTGNILRVPRNGKFSEYDVPSEGVDTNVQFLSFGPSKQKSLPYRPLSIVYVNGEPLLIKIISKGKPGFLAAADFREIIKPGSCLDCSASEMRLPSCDKSGVGLWGAWITTDIKDETQGKRARAIGFYGATGRAYWKD